jgi:predicted GNAT superfamily acetyltransferase
MADQKLRAQTAVGVSYQLVETLADAEIAVGVCREVWGQQSIRDTDTYFVAATCGGYFGIAWADGSPVGAAFGLLSNRGRSLHSHLAAVVPAYAGRGIGLGLKHHQRAWAAAQGMTAITWTFDPLVRRNAWFNIVRLGVSVTDYKVNYYGALGDAINGDDESDRLFVTWPVDPGIRSGSAVGSGAAGGDEPVLVVPLVDDVMVDTPPDIEGIRFASPAANGATPHEWRLRLRSELGERVQAGWSVVGLTRDYQYVLRRTDLCDQAEISLRN